MKARFIVMLVVQLCFISCQRSKVNRADLNNLRELSVQLEHSAALREPINKSESAEVAVTVEKEVDDEPIDFEKEDCVISSSNCENLTVQIPPTQVGQTDPEPIEDDSLKNKNIVLIIGTVIGVLGLIIASYGITTLDDEEMEFKDSARIFLIGVAGLIIALPLVLIGFAIEKQKKNRKPGINSDQMY